MMRVLFYLTLILLICTPAFAQDDTTTTDTAQSTVEAIFTACEDLAVVNLNGTMLTGFDVYFQVFSGNSIDGVALTNLRRINASGEYAFAERISYSNGQTIPSGGVGTLRVIIASASDPTSIAAEDAINDVQDGCADAINPLQTSADAGDPFGAAVGSTSSSRGILRPDGGILNPEVDFESEPLVVLGPRLNFDPRRSGDPGLVFAECDSFLPEGRPGLIYDSDNVRVFWSWFADTPQRVEENLSRAIYEVNLNGAPVQPVTRTSPRLINGNYWVFFEAGIGNLAPGHYEVEFKLDWSAPIFDGYAEFGPGTVNPQVRSNCNFDVDLNPFNAAVSYSGMYFPADPPSHDFERNIILQETIDEFNRQSNVGQPDE